MISNNMRSSRYFIARIVQQSTSSASNVHNFTSPAHPTAAFLLQTSANPPNHAEISPYPSTVRSKTQPLPLHFPLVWFTLSSRQRRVLCADEGPLFDPIFLPSGQL